MELGILRGVRLFFRNTENIRKFEQKPFRRLQLTTKGHDFIRFNMTENFDVFLKMLIIITKR